MSEGRGLLVLSALALGLVAGSCTSFAQQNSKALRTTHTLNVGGEERSYTVYRPVLRAGEKAPLMIVLHGGLGNAEAIETSTGMDSVADAGRFIVAYPNGTPVRMSPRAKTWNAGECCGPGASRNVDDVEFIAKMIDAIAAEEPVDPGRVYATGMSNGAMMAYRLACEMPERLAAIIAVSGTLMVDDCRMAKDVAVMHIHGDADRNVPFQGGVGEAGFSNVTFRPVPETIRMITEPRDCSGPETVALNASVQKTVYHCRNGAPVELLVIKGGGHAWPGGRRRPGQTGWTDAIFASQVAWDFAKQFVKKQ